MPTVTVRYFAVLKERRGTDLERVDVADGTTLRGLYDRLFPPGPAGRPTVGFVRNLEVVPADTELHDGDEVGFLPPLGGG